MRMDAGGRDCVVVAAGPRAEYHQSGMPNTTDGSPFGRVVGLRSEEK